MSTGEKNINSITVRFITDKPVLKTPYQVKGVLMKHFSNEAVIPFLNGRLRNKFLYPRVQVKILDEQIYLYGIKEGVEAVKSLSGKIKFFDFGNISFNVDSFDIDISDNNLILSDNELHNYDFLSPWYALNQPALNDFNERSESKKILLLNELLAKNIIFLAREFGSSLNTNIVTKLTVDSLEPNFYPEKKWGSFSASFSANFLFPNYIGLGNGITRGFGSIIGCSNKNIMKNIFKGKNVSKPFDLSADNPDLTMTNPDAIKIYKKKKKNNKKIKVSNKINQKPNSVNFNRIVDPVEPDFDEDARFNTEQYHKKQHRS
tara:strand:- start:127 stop:1080 length:954 start_codon:yes stop_codon:yes gene_type:complete